MTDMRDEPRDERLAERLHVEPLDEVTRARLVRTAMGAAEDTASASSTWTSRVRVLGIAAVLVVLVAVGLAVVVARDEDSGSGPTAADAPKTADAGRDPSLSATTERQEQEFSARAAAGRALGDLGDVGSAAKLRRAVGSVAAPTVTPNVPAAASDSASTAAGTPLSTTCSTNPVDRLGAVVAVGTGTADGEPVTVYVVERDNGSRVAVVVGADCVAREPVRL